MVAHLRGKSWPVNAYQSHLFSPLGITRIRGTVDLLSAQSGDEARYQCSTDVDDNGKFRPDLRVGQDLQSPDRPLVASGYGDAELAIAQGPGGISAAMTDLARFVSIMIDTPKIIQRLNGRRFQACCRQRQLSASGINLRAGYGLDGAQKLGSGRLPDKKAA